MFKHALLISATLIGAGALTEVMIASDAQTLLEEGASLSADEVEVLEAQLETDPLDMAARTRLLGYYGDLSRYSEPTSRARISPLLTWLIRNEPKSPLLGPLDSHILELDPYFDAAGYKEGKQAYLSHLEEELDDIVLLERVADFVSIGDQSLAIKLLERAQDLENSNPRFARKLGFMYYLSIRDGSGEPNVDSARKSLESYEQSYLFSGYDVSDGSLTYAAEAALAAGEYEKARKFADLMLDENEAGWNYGNYFHHGNIVLGMIALSQENIDDAASYLEIAGSTTGSPQLDSFGPDFVLARKLLEHGKKESVLRYLDLCTRFWDSGQDQLKEWKVLVTAGLIPSSHDFGH